MVFQTIREAEEYVKINFGINSVNFTDIDIAILNEFIKALDEMLKKYPNLIKYINSIGIASHIIKQLKLMLKEDYLDTKTREKVINIIDDILNSNDTNPMSLIHISIKNSNPYVALCFNSYLMHCDLETLSNNINKINEHTSVSKSNDPKVVIYHEFAHVLDYFLKVSSSVEFFRIIRNEFGNQEIPYYVFPEIFAQAFAEYYLDSKPTIFFEQTVALVDEMYNKKIDQNRSL